MSEGCFDGSKGTRMVFFLLSLVGWPELEYRFVSVNVLIEPEVSLRLNIAPCKTQILKFLEEKGLELKFDKETDEAWLVPSVSKLLLQKFTEAEYEEGKHTVYQPSIEP